MKTALLLSLAMLAGLGPLQAQDAIVLESGPAKKQVIELFTSEGCSSCPPADEWLAQFKESPDLWDRIVPMAFHVDYWDRLGWQDELARPEFSHRQRRYREQGGISQVYTPGIVIDGQEWRGFFHGGKVPDIRPVEAGEITARLDHGLITAEFRVPGDIPGALVFHAAILGFNLVSEVQAGENRGKTLRHEFAVISYSRASAMIAGNTYRASLGLPETRILAGDKAIVVWVSTETDQSPVQAAGDWL